MLHNDWVILDEAQSTNDVAFELMSKNKAGHFTTIFAHTQLYGRGQQLSVWESESRQNINMSVILLPYNMQIQHLHFLTMICSLSIAITLEKILKENVSIKWPNDIIINDHKIAGVLIENIIQGNEIMGSVMGIGINVNQTHFLPYTPPATSLHLITGVQHKTLDIAANVVGKIKELYDYFLHNNRAEIKKMYMSKLYRLNTPSMFYLKDELLIGTIYDVNDFGLLCINFENGNQQVFAPKELKYYY